VTASTPSRRTFFTGFHRSWLWLVLLATALLITGLAALLSPLPVAAAGTCYVDASATGAANGTSWTNAYLTVQDALADATCTEIWVAQGVYYPDEGAGQTADQ